MFFSLKFLTAENADYAEGHRDVKKREFLNIDIDSSLRMLCAFLAYFA